MKQEILLYNDTVKLKFSPGNHCYYANGKICQGVTSALKELYPQDDLLEWYSGMAAQDIVLSIAPESWHEELKKAFLALYNDKSPEIKELATWHVELSQQKLVELYLTGKQAPLKRSQYGKDVGTQVHEAIDKWHKFNHARPMEIAPLTVEPSGDDEQDKVAQKSFDAYIKWFTQSGLEVVESERMIYSITYNFAGTLDRIYRTPSGALILGDFKTSNLSKKSPLGVRDSYWSQLGGYILAYEEEMGVKFDDAIIVNSPKNGSLKVAYAGDMGLNPSDLSDVFIQDLKALRNHKQLRNKLSRLKSKT